MKKYNVLFITPKLNKPTLYHTDIIDVFEKLYNVFQYGPGFEYYNSNDSIQTVIKKSGMDPDLIVFGTAMVLYHLNIEGLDLISIPKIIFLNKEYQSLQNKLNYIEKNKFDLVSTILNEKTYKPWEKSIGIPFVQTPHGIFVDKFPALNIEKKYDFGFLGALFMKQGVTYRKRAKDFIFKNTDISEKYNILWGDENNKMFFYDDEYIKMLNSCKMFLSTLSPSGIIGLRFYELSAVKTMILCPRDYYDGVFEDGVNCIMYDDNPNSFKEKFEQYIKDDKARNKIIERAYKDVLEKHSWDQRIQNLIITLKNIRGNNMSNESIYSSFNNIPWKLIRANSVLHTDKIKPLHIRLYPTNRCNANCAWCCYSERDRSLELDIYEIKKIIKYFRKLGTKAITFSGGGEPTLHPNIKDMLDFAKKKGIECGIVTNGLLWGKKDVDLDFANKTLTWARISVIETIKDYDTEHIINFADNLNEVDIGISFVVPEEVNIPLAKSICDIARDTNNIKHVKFIQDSFVLGDRSMQLIIDSCRDLTEKAFFIWRDSPKKGNRNCRVSLIKPVVDASGHIYPCCDVQHSGPADVRFMPDEYRMCHWRDFGQVIGFDGTDCNKCYYSVYNDFLEMMVKEPYHDVFL